MLPREELPKPHGPLVVVAGQVQHEVVAHVLERHREELRHLALGDVDRLGGSLVRHPALLVELTEGGATREDHLLAARD